MRAALAKNPAVRPLQTIAYKAIMADLSHPPLSDFVAARWNKDFPVDPPFAPRKSIPCLPVSAFIPPK